MMLAKPKTEIVPLTAIVVEQAINPRAGGTSEELATDYAEEMDKGQEQELAFFDKPPVAYKDRHGTIRLSEGFTRFRAFQLRGKYGIPCIVRNGDRRDAALNAAASNCSHGLRRSNEDKEKAVAIVLEVCPEWSDNRIAQQAGVSQPFVGKVRAQLITVIRSPEKRIGADGRERMVPVPSTVSGGTPVPPDTPRNPPPAIASPPRGVELPPPDPRTDFEADVILLVASLKTAAAEAERLGFTAFGSTIGHRKAIPKILGAVADLWADRKGTPPG